MSNWKTICIYDPVRGPYHVYFLKIGIYFLRWSDLQKSGVGKDEWWLGNWNGFLFLACDMCRKKTTLNWSQRRGRKLVQMTQVGSRKGLGAWVLHQVKVIYGSVANPLCWGPQTCSWKPLPYLNGGCKVGSTCTQNWMGWAESHYWGP